MIKLDKKNVATFGFPQYEMQGTIGIDFANDFDKIARIPGINLDANYFIKGIEFNKSIFDDNENCSLKIIIENFKNNEVSYILRSISKKQILNIMVRVKIQLSNSIDFENDTIQWKNLKNLEEQ